MIFVTVGAQLPFDRLVDTVDAWAGRKGDTEVLAQIAGGRRPTHMEWEDFLDPEQFRSRVESAELVVAHAGMGSILTALEYGKPILVLARRGALGETRNDHQVATAKRLRQLGRVVVAEDETDLVEQLDRVGSLPRSEPIGARACGGLIDEIRRFMADVEAGRK